MNKSHISIIRIAIIMSLALFCQFSIPQAFENNWSKKKIDKWYKSCEWLNGCQLKPHKSVNIKAFTNVYFSNKVAWDKTFEWLKITDLNSLEPGRYVIDEDNSVATVSEAPAPTIDKVKWEAHRNFSDLQYIIKGEAKMGSVSLSKANITEPFDDKRDIGFYEASGALYKAEPGTFFIFTPSDVHRPGVKDEGYDAPVKKIVIKIKVARSN